MCKLHSFSLFLLAPALFAQTHGQLAGRVTDAAGAFVPGAEVRAVNIGTNVPSDTRTNAEGNYRLPNLIPGAYRVEIGKEGFKKFVRDIVEVRLGDVLTLDVALELGQIQESITVTSEAPLLESGAATLGQTIDTRRVQDLPSPGNSVIAMVHLSPGVISLAPPTQSWTPNQGGPTGRIAVAGTKTGGSQFAIDGNTVSNGSSTTINPNPEMVQEVRVSTTAYDASLGRFTGAHINMMTKAGTNDFRGSFVYTNLSRWMVAQDYFTKQFINDPATGPVTPEKIETAWPEQRRIRYRGSISGPVLLPKLYNGRNRTFWTFGPDVYQERTAEHNFATVPGEAQRRGDFSQLLTISSQYQLYDPDTIRAAAGGRTQRSPLPGNLVPASRIAPMARKLLEYYPLPNTAGTIDGRNNFSSPTPRVEDFQQSTARLDHVLTEAQRLSGSFTWGGHDATYDNILGGISRGVVLTRRQKSAALNHVTTLRPDLIVDLRYGLTRWGDMRTGPSNGFDLASLGFTPELVRGIERENATLPQLNITGYYQIGGGTAGGAALSWAPVLYHTFTGQTMHVRGNHTLRVGSEFRVMQKNNYNTGNLSPSFTFGTEWTRGPLDNSPAAPIGGGLATFLLGRLTAGNIDRNASYAMRSYYLAPFFQDDWKITKKLTLNLGLRYELDFPTTERFNRASRGYDFTARSPVEAAAKANYARAPMPELPLSQFETVGGLLFAGVGGVPRAMWARESNNLAPRVGFAYLARPGTVVRAGYGVYYTLLGVDQRAVIQQGFSRRTAIVPTLDNGVTFRASMENPFPDGVLQPAGAADGLATNLGQSLTVFPTRLRSGYMQRWSFNVQQALPGRMLFDIGYIGNRGTGLEMNRNLAVTPAQYLSTSPVRDQRTIDYLSAQVTNPFFGLPEFQGTGLQSRTVSRASLLRPYPHFTGLTVTTNDGFSWYHALQVRVDKRFSRGFSVEASYMFSKFMEAVGLLNATDPWPNRVISDADRPHAFVMTGLWDLPFGKRRQWAPASRFVDGVLGGWSLQTMVQLQLGPPVDWGNILFYGNVKDIPLPRGQRTPERWFNTEAGFEKDNRLQLANNIRTFPTRLSGVRAPGVRNVNLSAFKEFKLKERLAVQFRAEAVDLFNTPHFDPPSAAATSTLFGQLTSIGAATQRRVTLGGKISW